MKCSHSESRALSRLLLREKGDRGAVDEELAQVPTNGRPYDIFSVHCTARAFTRFLCGKEAQRKLSKKRQKKKGAF